MKTVYNCILVFVLQFALKSHCVENNVCKTIQDYYTIKNNSNCEYDVAADPNANPMTVITSYGYPGETHKVKTLDGYILTMFRIPNDQLISKKGPVFLQHSLEGSAANYLALGKHSLAVILADAGYDVWLGNFRGNEFSEEHVNLTVFDKQFWDYNIDELALYDLPAQLDYVSEATGNKGDIVYIGHSLGTTTSLMYSSAFPKHASSNVKLLILLGAAATVSYIKAPILSYPRSLFKPLARFAMDNDLIRLVSQAKIARSVIRQVCLESPRLLKLCRDLLNILAFGPQSQRAPKTIPVFLNQIPGGTSFQVFSQAADLIMGNFRRHDYGLKNLEKYSSNTPPPYVLKNIEIPVFVAYAINDWTVTPEDTLNLYNNLPPKVRYGKYEIRVPNFNHNDYMVGKNAKSIVYDIILQVMDRAK